MGIFCYFEDVAVENWYPQCLQTKAAGWTFSAHWGQVFIAVLPVFSGI
jgi:hypothetical protein